MTRRLLAAAAAVSAGISLGGCGDSGPGATATVTGSGTSTTVTPLRVALAGQPDRSFVVHGGKWRVCDRGEVTNLGGLVARDVRVTVVYVDHGTPVGQLSAEDALGDGGALGDIPAGQSRPFTVCGLADQEPDQDRVEAIPAR